MALFSCSKFYLQSASRPSSQWLRNLNYSQQAQTYSLTSLAKSSSQQQKRGIFFNRAFISVVGYVGGTPEVRTFDDGTQMASFSVAVSSYKPNSTSEKETDWFTVSTFNERHISQISQFVTKGAKVFVEGTFKTKTYTDAKGVEKKALQILMTHRGDFSVFPKGDKELVESATGSGESSDNNNKHEDL